MKLRNVLLLTISLLETIAPSLAAAPRAGQSVALNPVAARDVASLSLTERQTLPDDTIVAVPSRGMVALKTLRAEHALMQTSFAAAAKLGALDAAALAAAVKAEGRKQVPWKSPPGVPIDYTAYCNAAAASACLYYPAGIQLFADGDPSTPSTDRATFTDWSVDTATCRSEGGSYGQDSGCTFSYPVYSMGNFNPGPPAPGKSIGSNASYNQSCTTPNPYATAFDKRGSFSALLFVPSHHAIYMRPSPNTCLMYVYISTP